MPAILSLTEEGKCPLGSVSVTYVTLVRSLSSFSMMQPPGFIYPLTTSFVSGLLSMSQDCKATQKVFPSRCVAVLNMKSRSEVGQGVLTSMWTIQVSFSLFWCKCSYFFTYSLSKRGQSDISKNLITFLKENGTMETPLEATVSQMLSLYISQGSEEVCSHPF